MLTYIIKRCVMAVITLFVLITVIFVLVRLLPGDPFISEKTNEAIRQSMIQYHGFDRPIYE
jgi:oligopeptide transport system permease protein